MTLLLSHQSLSACKDDEYHEQGLFCSWFVVTYVNTDTEGALESDRVNEVSVFRENVKAFFPQEQSKLSVIMKCSF